MPAPLLVGIESNPGPNPPTFPLHDAIRRPLLSRPRAPAADRCFRAPAPPPRRFRDQDRVPVADAILARIRADKIKRKDDKAATSAKKRGWTWGKAQDDALAQLKVLVQTAPVLAKPDYRLPFHVFVAAKCLTRGGTGACLRSLCGLPQPKSGPSLSDRLEVCSDSLARANTGHCAATWMLLHTTHA